MKKEVTDEMIYDLRFKQGKSPRSISKELKDKYGIDMSPAGITGRIEKISKEKRIEIPRAGKEHISDELMKKLVKSGFTLSEILEINQVNLSKSSLWRDYNKACESLKDGTLEELDEKLNNRIKDKKESEKLLEKYNSIAKTKEGEVR